MTNEEKQLLLKDLCARLPYGVIVNVDNGKYREDMVLWPGLFGEDRDISNSNNLWDVKPYLRLMSSMTEEEKTREIWLKEYGTPEDYVDFCLSHHLDYRTTPMGISMIDYGLALEAPEGMYKTE